MKKFIRNLTNDGVESGINNFFDAEGSYVENKENVMSGLGKAIVTGAGLYKASKLMNKKRGKPKDKVSGIAFSNNSKKKQRQMANEPVVSKDKNGLGFNL